MKVSIGYMVYYKKLIYLYTTCSVILLTSIAHLVIIVKAINHKGEECAMIAGYGSKPVFQYKFRPLMQDRRAPDGGFSVILYENRILSFSTYDVNGAFIDELCFPLNGQVIQCFYGLLRNASSWLGATPCDLRGAVVTPYASSFAFDGYDPIRVWGINDLLLQAPGTEAGFFARHLLVLFEDIANLLSECGIRLTLDGFTWDMERVRPFRKSQLYASARQNAV